MIDWSILYWFLAAVSFVLSGFLIGGYIVRKK